MRYFDTFSGIGGFPLGIQLAYETIRDSDVQEKRGGETTAEGKLQEDWERLHTVSSQTTVSSDNGNNEYPDRSFNQRQPTCIGFSEIDKYATQIYQKHFPNHTNYGDITQINAEELPNFDLLVGGFPCQAFSIAGKRGGFEDTRGTMFFELARILQAKQPRLFVFENVKGLLSHDGGKSFATIIQTLDDLGYDCGWQVLNSKNHGVPQNRERVFIIGNLRGFPRPKVFPFGEATGATNQRLDQSNTEVASTLRSRYGNGTGSHIKQLNQPTHSNDRVYGTDGVSPTLNTMQGGNRQPFVSDDLMIRDGRDNRSCLRAGRTPEMGVKGASIRRLTPTECERLQGFPSMLYWTDMNRDELTALALSLGTIKVVPEEGRVFVLRGPGGITIEPREAGTECSGYLVANLSADGVKKQVRLHRVVWIAVNGIPPKGMAVCHQNNNKKDNRIENLYLATKEQNTTDAANDGLLLGRGAKIDFEIAQAIRMDYETEKHTMRELAERYGISKSRIGQIIKMQGWTESISDTQRYKCLGNAVTVNVIRDIFVRVLQ